MLVRPKPQQLRAEERARGKVERLLGVRRGESQDTRLPSRWREHTEIGHLQ